MQQYNAVHIRQSPNLRQALRDVRENNGALLGTIMGLPSPDLAKVIAVTDGDWLMLDAEHTPYSPTLLAEMVTIIRYHSQGRVIPVVRVPTHTHEWVAWALDAGAGGVIIPHTETADQVREAINAARFPPAGKRSYPPFALLPIDGQTAAPEGKTWFQVANEHVAVIPQLESLKGMENAEEIMQIEGVDAIMIGRFDLSLDMGGTPDSPPVKATIERVEALGRKYGKPLLSFTFTNDEIPDKVSRGYHILANASDIYTLTAGVNELMATGRKAIKLLNEGKANGKANGAVQTS